MDRMTDFKILNTGDAAALEAEIKKALALGQGWAVTGFGQEEIGAKQFWATLARFEDQAAALSQKLTEVKALADAIKTESDKINALDPTASGADLADIKAKIATGTGVIATKVGEIKAK